VGRQDIRAASRAGLRHAESLVCEPSAPRLRRETWNGCETSAEAAAVAAAPVAATATPGAHCRAPAMGTQSGRGGAAVAAAWLRGSARGQQTVGHGLRAVVTWAARLVGPARPQPRGLVPRYHPNLCEAPYPRPTSYQNTLIALCFPRAASRLPAERCAPLRSVIQDLLLKNLLRHVW